MKTSLAKTVLASVLFMFIGIGALAQNTIYSDDFNRALLGTSYTISPGGGGGNAYIVNNTTLQLTNGSPAGWVSVATNLPAGNGFSSTLDNCAALVTWTFNMRFGRTGNTPSGFTSGNYGTAFILAAGGSDFSAANTKGYAVMFGNTSSPDTFRLVAFTNGIVADYTATGSAAGNALIVGTGAFSVTTQAAANDYYSFKVTYDPSTKVWTLYGRDDGSSAFADPAAGSYTTIGTFTETSAIFRATALGRTGAYWSHSTAANNTSQFDNFKLTVAPATTTTVLTSSVNPSTYNQSVTFIASVQTNGVTAGNATSNYVFKVDGVAVATNAVSGGSATYTVNNLLSGARRITAEYAGDANYSASTNTVLTQTVNRATTTVTLAVVNSPVTYSGAGQSATVSITASNMPGSVQTVLTGGFATQTNSGTYAVTASYVPVNTNFTTLTGINVGNFTINKAAPSFNLVSSANPSGYKDTVTFSASSFAADVTGTVQFITNGVNLGSPISLTGATASSSGAAGLPRGTTNLITAIYSGEPNYFPLTNALVQTVTNHLPVAANVSFSRNAGLTSLHIPLTNLLAAVTDVDGDSIALVSASVTTNGITLVNTSGYLNYFNTNSVNDEFTYTVTDGFGGTNTAKVSLVVNNTFIGGQAQGIALVSNTATLNFAGIPTYGYAVQRSTNLITWEDVFSTNAPTSGAFQFVDDLNPVPPPSVFYRLRYQP